MIFKNSVPMQKQIKNGSISNQRGQGLIEYLIIVALMSVAAIGIVRVMGQSLNSRFAEISYALRGKKVAVKEDSIENSYYKKKDLGDFIDGVASRDGSGGGSSGGASGATSGNSSSGQD